MSLIDIIADQNKKKISKNLDIRRAKKMRKAIKRVLGIDIGFDPIEGFVDLGQETYITSFGFSAWTERPTVLVQFGKVESWIYSVDELGSFVRENTGHSFGITDKSTIIKERIELYRNAIIS